MIELLWDSNGKGRRVQVTHVKPNKFLPYVYQIKGTIVSFAKTAFVEESENRRLWDRFLGQESRIRQLIDENELCKKRVKELLLYKRESEKKLSEARDWARGFVEAYRRD